MIVAGIACLGAVPGSVVALQRSQPAQVRWLGLASAAVAAIAGAAAVVDLRRSIHRLTEELDAESRDIVEAADQVSLGRETSDAIARKESAAIDEASASLQQASQHFRENAEKTEAANALAAQTHEAADSGVRALQAIGDSVEALNQSSSQISAIVQSIHKVAFETNLLALNAAVEAARAGASGAGFAIVADEVRKLAKDTADSARETSEKIEEVSNWIAQTGMLKEELVSTLNDIAGKASKLAAMMDEVSKSSRGETQSIDQVNANVSQINRDMHAGLESGDSMEKSSADLHSRVDRIHASLAALERSN